MTKVVGIDGCPGGWVAVLLEEGRFADAWFAARFELAVEAAGDAAVIAVDMPIGLPEEGGRAADLEARRLLGRQRASVF